MAQNCRRFARRASRREGKKWLVRGAPAHCNWRAIVTCRSGGPGRVQGCQRESRPASRARSRGRRRRGHERVAAACRLGSVGWNRAPRCSGPPTSTGNGGGGDIPHPAYYKPLGRDAEDALPVVVKKPEKNRARGRGWLERTRPGVARAHTAPFFFAFSIVGRESGPGRRVERRPSRRWLPRARRRAARRRAARRRAARRRISSASTCLRGERGADEAVEVRRGGARVCGARRASCAKRVHEAAQRAPPHSSSVRRERGTHR